METFTLGPRPSDRKQLAAWYGALLDEQERRGQSVAKFALEMGVNFVTLYSWKRRLHSQVAPSQEPQPSLVQVRVADAATRPGPAPMILRLRSERSVEISEGFDALELTRLVKAIEGC
ncbi:MAG: hypothetical protein ACI8X5_002652 [Planctomycetota bacterium]|jgi:hypothetical protein